MFKCLIKINCQVECSLTITKNFLNKPTHLNVFMKSLLILSYIYCVPVCLKTVIYFVFVYVHVCLNVSVHMMVRV